MKTLSGKKIIVTGGSRGIGKALAAELHRHGASVLICARNTKEITAVCKEIDPKGKNVIGMQADVSKEADCKNLIKFALKKFGKIDVLVNNAGVVGQIETLEKSALSKWFEPIKVNLFGTASTSKYALGPMKKAGGGKIINFAGAGVGGKRPVLNLSAYYSSKMAIVGLTETLAAEVENDNIQVNCVAPGAVSKGDPVQPVLDLIVFLLSSQSSHITGRILSAKWDKIEMLKKLKKEDSDLFKLRRIDNDLFSGT